MLWPHAIDPANCRCLTAALPLIATASATSAQTYWSYGDYGPRAKGYYGTPYDGGPQYGSGGGDTKRQAGGTRDAIESAAQ